MTGPALIDIHLNGAPRRLVDPALTALIEAETGSRAPPGVAVAVNERVVPRSRWAEVALRPDDRVELVRATQGG